VALWRNKDVAGCDRMDWSKHNHAIIFVRYPCRKFSFDNLTEGTIVHAFLNTVRLVPLLRRAALERSTYPRFPNPCFSVVFFAPALRSRLKKLTARVNAVFVVRDQSARRTIASSPSRK
jgi:hypothetical protein